MNTSDKEARDENAVLSKKNATAETTDGAEAVKAAENGGKQRNKIPEVAERLIGKMMTLLDTEAVSAQGIKSLTSALKDLKDLREGCGEGDGNGVLILPEIEIEPTKNAVDGESGSGGEGTGGEGNGGQGQNGGGE